MRLDHIEASNCRNLADFSFEPDPRLTVISGANAQGKTNLLECVWLLSGARTFAASRDSAVIRHGESRARIFGRGMADSAGEPDRPFSIELEFVDDNDFESPHYGFSRTAKKNGVSVGSAGNLAGELPCVLFEPGDMAIIEDVPEYRRRFLDRTLCQLYPGYLNALRRYNHVLKQKNYLLKNLGKPFHEGLTPALIDTYNEQLAKYGSIIFQRRYEYVGLLNAQAQQVYSQISQGREQLVLRYEPIAQTRPERGCNSENTTPRAFNEYEFYAVLYETRDLDIKNRVSTIGPHRDELSFLLNGEPARQWGSRGQKRSVVLASKLSELEVLHGITGRQPLLLLDDVLSELDGGRQDFLLNRIEGKQVFITSCNPELFVKTGGKVVTLQDGRFV